MFAVLHALILWHKEWIHSSVTIISDNTKVVSGITKRSVKGAPLGPLCMILLVAAVLDIEIKAHWIPSEENVIADAASRHHFKKLTNLGFKDQVKELRHRPSTAIKMADLRCQLNDFFNPHLLYPQEEITSLSEKHMKLSALVDTVSHTQHLSLRSPIGLPHV